MSFPKRCGDCEHSSVDIPTKDGSLPVYVRCNHPTNIDFMRRNPGYTGIYETAREEPPKRCPMRGAYRVLTQYELMDLPRKHEENSGEDESEEGEEE